MRDEWRNTAIAWAFAALIVGAILLILYGVGRSYIDCKNHGGEYVRKLSGGYTCVDKDDK